MHPALKTIEQDWEDFSGKSLPALPKETEQYKDCRQIFYAGYFSMLAQMKTIGFTEEITEDEGVLFLEERWDELRDFARTQVEAAKR